MGIVLHRSVPDDVALCEQWNRLVLQMERPEVFYTHQWALAVQRAYGEELVPWTLLSYEGEQLTAVASLAIETATRRATFLANTTADYCDVLSLPADRASWVHSVFESLRSEGVEEVVLPNLPGDSTTARVLGAAGRKHGYRLFLRDAYLCAQVQLGSDQERRDLKTTVQKRKIVRRGLNFLRRHGQLDFVHRRRWNEIEAELDEFNLAHVSRFLADGHISNLANRQRRVFLRELACSLSQQGWLVLSQMLVDGRPMASNFGFQFEGSWFWYQPTFDMLHEQISPGYCLLSTIIAEACDCSDVRLVDLGLGAEGYKERVANGARQTVHGTLTTSRRRLVTVRVRHFAGGAAKRSPFLEHNIRSAFSAWSSIRERRAKERAIPSAALSPTRWARRFVGREEVIFYQWRGEAKLGSRSLDVRLEPLTWKILAETAMRFEQDLSTRRYILRAARRFKNGGSQGFVLLDPGGGPLHFCWASVMRGFYMAELRTQIGASNSQDWVIFDCWTPVGLRGHRYYGTAVDMAACHLESLGRRSFLFSAASNQSSIRGLERTGFVRDFSLFRWKPWFLGSVEKVASREDAACAELASPQARR